MKSINKILYVASFAIFSVSASKPVAPSIDTTLIGLIQAQEIDMSRIVPNPYVTEKSKKFYYGLWNPDKSLAVNQETLIQMFLTMVTSHRPPKLLEDLGELVKIPIGAEILRSTTAGLMASEKKIDIQVIKPTAGTEEKTFPRYQTKICTSSPLADPILSLLVYEGLLELQRYVIYGGKTTLAKPLKCLGLGHELLHLLRQINGIPSASKQQSKDVTSAAVEALYEGVTIKGDDSASSKLTSMKIFSAICYSNDEEFETITGLKLSGAKVLQLTPMSEFGLSVSAKQPVRLLHIITDGEQKGISTSSVVTFHGEIMQPIIDALTFLNEKNEYFPQVGVGDYAYKKA
jgi:hypothetical protein